MSSDPRWLLMKEIYFAASELPLGERAQFLADRCPDEAMRREVAKLLDESSEDETRVTLDSLVPPGAPTQTGEGLAAGDLVAHYRIKQRLGAGGMGWVYEGYDEKLRRTIALKVLPPGPADESQRRRLTREAQSASALNHPNIVIVYEVGRDGGTDFIAMERIHGRTLRELSGSKGLNARTAIRYAIQIADALAAAHEAKIVHRDLKPGNIMITERGLVKVLDFGIAKHVERSGEDLSVSISRTGEVMGTLAYMSPEQAQGLPVDARSDIFSFGSVIYEMLTGRRAFLAESGVATMGAVISKEPTPLKELLSDLPRGLERVVSKCMEKKPLDRWQHMSDVKLILQDLAKDFDLPAEAPRGAPARRFRWIGIGAGLAAGAVLVYFFTRTPAPAPRSSLRRVTSDTGLSLSPVLSRDGKLLAFSSNRAAAENLDIWVQQVGGGEPIRLTSNPADETDPAFSPDGTRIAFRSEANGGGIYVAPTLGGEPVLLVREGRGPRFSPDGRTITYWTGDKDRDSAGASQVFVIDANGGQPRPIGPGMSWAHSPIWSPRGDAVLTYAMKEQTAASLDWWVLPVNGGEPLKTAARTLVAPNPGDGFTAAIDWLDDGVNRVVYSSRSGDAVNLWEIPFAASLSAKGPARRLTRGPGIQRTGSMVSTAAGALSAFADETENAAIWQLPLGPNPGPPQRITDGLAPEFGPSISADGSRMIFLRRTFGGYSILAHEIGSSKERLLTSSTLTLPAAQAGADFRRIFFSSGRLDLTVMPIAGGTPEVFCPGCGSVTAVSNDGAYVLYEPNGKEDLPAFSMAAKATLKLAERPQEQSAITGAKFSSDGKWIVFLLTRSDIARSVVYLVPFDPKRIIPLEEWLPLSAEEDRAGDPAWGPGGDIVYFTSQGDGFRCLWARRLDALTKRPVGGPFPVQHFHSARLSLGSVGPRGRFAGLSVAASRIVFAMTERTGSIWLEEPAAAKGKPW